MLGSRKKGGAPKASRARSPRKAAPKRAPRRTSAGRAPQRKAKAPALLATADPTDPASIASFRGGGFARRARAGRCCWPGFAHSARRAARAPSPRRVCGGAACCTRRARRAAAPACGTVGGRAARVHACRRLTTVPRPAAAPRVRHTSRATPWLHPYAPYARVPSQGPLTTTTTTTSSACSSRAAPRPAACGPASSASRQRCPSWAWATSCRQTSASTTVSSGGRTASAGTRALPAAPRSVVE